MTGVLSFGEASSEGGKSEGILIWNGFDAQEPALQLHTIIIMTWQRMRAVTYCDENINHIQYP